MEVSGRRKAGSEPVSKASDIEAENHCDPCKHDGRSVAAKGYCVDCKEYLCTGCYRVHLRPSVWRHHQLLDAQTMPKTKPATNIKVTDVCTEVCQKHSDKVIEYFCNPHEILGCSACITTEHRSCIKVDYIPVVAATFGKSKEFNNLHENLESLLSLNEKNKSNIRNKSKVVDIQADRAKVQVTALRTEVDALFDRLEEKIDRSIDDVRNRDKKKIVKLSNKSDAVSANLKDHISVIETKVNEGKICQLFIETKRMEESERKLHAEVQTIAEDSNIQIFQFQPDQMIVDMMEKLTVIGKLKVLDKNAKRPHFEGEINVKAKTETKKCNITGMSVLSKNQLVVADYMNGCVKLLSIVNKDVISVYKKDVLDDSDPFDVTKVNDAQIAVTYPSAWEIRILDIPDGGNLKSDREINATGACYGIVRSGDNLVVSFNTPPEVKILTLDGKVVKKITGHYNFPDYVAFNPYRNTIYISDVSLDTLTCVTTEGKNVSYDKRLGGPCGVAVDANGQVFVCCRSKNSVLQLLKGSKRPHVLLHNSYGVRYPQCITISEQNTLFVGLADDKVKMFQLY
ncbi:E3 ubiquitin-protein ligase TRIM71-like [Mercenaria mercenaria]|uniref:E3 ubiquitin-protein ligase TRIM71-like n=1 Tax=Mercenaria mercenaria TaxID=6596 RepID=UPI00234EA1CB|nr:E3 ubiquitin-protein ligase TRIM71-like [Mercenaria mercenaria]